MALSPERKLKKVTIDLMRSPLFADMSGVLMLGTKTIDDNVPTACTDGYNERYGRKFVDALSIKSLSFVVLHESMHKLLRQLTVWQALWKISPELTNMAADYVVNLMLVERDPDKTIIEMPVISGVQLGLLDQRFKGMNTKQVFDILRKEQQSGQSGGGNGQPGGKPGQGGGKGFDEHDWEGAKDATPEERDAMERELDRAIRQGQIAAQKMAGKGHGNMNRELDDLLNPKVDWRELMREFVTATCAGRDYSSWQRPNRRFLSQGIVMPTLIGECVETVVIGCDTSGSISQAEHTRNISETAEILNAVKPRNIHVIYWDSRVAGHEVYDESNRDAFATTTKPKGGGGTDPTSMMRYLKEKHIKADCIIQFTDGCLGDWGNDWDAPLLWCITGQWGRNTYAPCGKTVHVED